MNLTNEQYVILNDNSNESLAIKAVAGSGKSFLLKQYVRKYISENPDKVVIILAVMNTVKDELTKALADLPNVFICTAHTLGNSIYKQYNKGSFIHKDYLHGKNGNLDNKYKAIINRRFKDYKIAKSKITTKERMKQLVDMIRLTGTVLNVNDVYDMCCKYGLLSDKEIIAQAIDIVYEGIDVALSKNRKNRNNTVLTAGDADYTDMIYMPYYLKLDTDSLDINGFSIDLKKIGLVCVDEAQDLNVLQHNLVKLLLKYNAKLFMVGDPRQSIMAFAGSDPQSYINMIKMFGCKEYQLSYTFRCPKLHTDYISTKFGISMNPFDVEKSGYIDIMKYNTLAQTVLPNDIILARGFKSSADSENTNKGVSLSLLMLDLLKNNVGCYTTKYNPLTELTGLLKELEDNSDNFNFNNLDSHIDEYTKKFFTEYSSNDRLALLNDFELLKEYIVFTQANSSIDFRTKLYQLNNNRKKLVHINTIHTSKGLESQNIFILNGHQLPLTKEKQTAVQNEQEINLAYIAFSRSLNRNIIIS